MSNELYADSAQARELDRRMRTKYDEWGNPVQPADAFCFDYESVPVGEEEKERRKKSAARIKAAIGQMEAIWERRKAMQSNESSSS